MSPERHLSPRPIDFNQLLDKRAELAREYGPLTERQVQSGLKLISPLAENTPKNMADNPLVRVDLTRRKESYRQRGIKVSTPHLTTDYVGGIMELFLQDFTEQHSKKFDFSVTIDFAVGYFVALNHLMLTEDAIKGTLGKKVRETLKDLGLNPPEEEMAISVENLSKNQDLLIKDNTGKTLMRAVVQNLEEGTDLGIDYVAKELAVKGAQCAEQAYNAVYPIAERVNRG